VLAEGVDFSPDGRWLITGGHHGARLWHAETLRELAYFGLDTCGPASFHPSGREVVTFGVFSQAWRWPLQRTDSYTLRWQLGPARRIIPRDAPGFIHEWSYLPQHHGRHAAWSRDGKLLAMADYRNGRVLLTESDNGSAPKVFANLLNAGRVAISGSTNSNRL